MTFWRWVLQVFKRPRKPTAKKSTSENPRRKRPIFVMESIQSTNEMAFKKTVILHASFPFPAIRFDAPTLLSFSGFTHAHAKCPPAVLNRTVVVDSDWRFNNLCGSHLQSQSELYHVSWWYYTLVIDLIGQLHSLWIWRWLLHRLSKRQSLSTTTVLFRTTFTQTIKLNLLLRWLLGSNLSHYCSSYLKRKWCSYWTPWRISS